MTDKSSHVSRSQLVAMSARETVAAMRRGELRHLLNPRGVTLDELHGWAAEDVLSAQAEGRLEHLGIEPEKASKGGMADQGQRGKKYTSMRDRLEDMSPGEIAAGLRRGDFDALLRGDAA
jgi:hypothetical protein